MSTNPNPDPVKDRKNFEEAVEAQRQQFIEEDIAMHNETDEDSPVDVGEAQPDSVPEYEAEPELKKSKKK